MEPSQPTQPRLVSVVVPVHNMERYLPETLDSILASDYPSLEVVVVNDGSSDGSLAVAQGYASRDRRVKVITQRNSGVCRARNTAIHSATGHYILPVDADDRIEPTFVSRAVAAIESRPGIKVVAPRADFFGDRTGEWRLPPFSLRLLARKNIMACCALFRREEWERTGGYCEEIVAREDWEFWIAVLKNGGDVVRLPSIELHYRVQRRSKRVNDRRFKRHVIDVLNRRHPDFFERELHGPLRYRRTWSRLTNSIYRLFHPRHVFVNPACTELQDYVKALPRLFAMGAGVTIHEGRNELRVMSHGTEEYVVKSFRVPNFINRVAYGLLRASKAERSYRNAQRLREAGIGSPEPVAFYTERAGLLFSRSYYVCRKSACPHTYARLIGGRYPHQEAPLRAIARTVARMHDMGFLHKDLSRGNILFGTGPDGVRVEIIDLNRIRFREPLSIEDGCRNLAERLPATDRMQAILADEYAAARGADAARCLALIRQFNIEKH